jgi:uncharacterized membrane protein YedE/YeeE
MNALEQDVEARGSAREQNVGARGFAREQNVEARGFAREQNVEARGFAREQNLVAFSVGVLLALALGFGRLTRPEVILGWVDVLGAWDATLFWFMLGASGVFAPCHAWVRRRGAPLLACTLALPVHKHVDRPLLIGSALFGVGWALGGVCPGPALTALGGGVPWVVLFVAAMALGLWLGSPDRLAAWGTRVSSARDARASRA